MESLGYTLIHLLHRLPWEYTSNDDTTLQLKDDNLEELCEGLPEEFKVYMDHVRNLGYAEAPRYDYLRRLFQRAFKRNNYTYDKVFDWTKSRYLEG
jgi:casein kinase 1